ncbi:MAG: nickel pincer cofactor biosynthesis protein LarC [Bacteriovoracia bacterium]
MKALFLEGVSGIAGDMFAASFIDAGLIEKEELISLPGKLKITGVEIVIKSVVRSHVKATHLNVEIKNGSWEKEMGFQKHSHDFHSTHHHTHYVDLDKFLENSDLNPEVKSLSRRVFYLLAEAEGRAHGVDVKDVAFHEVGAVDSILDVIMAATCVCKLMPERIFSTPIQFGRGYIKMDHGLMKIPPPATVLLSEGLEIRPTQQNITEENIELSTPTGVAIIKALNVEFVDSFPAGKLLKTGVGAGTLELKEFPNIFRVNLLEVAETTKSQFESDEVFEIDCNLDDESSEKIAWALAQCIEMGALDAWQQAVYGKKSRLGVQLSVLCKKEDLERFTNFLLTHTSSFGVRFSAHLRHKLCRTFEVREIDGKKVRFKIGSNLMGEKLKEKAEFEDIQKTW